LSIRASAILILLARNFKLLARILKWHIQHVSVLAVDDQLQISKDNDKKEYEYQKYIYYTSKGYQYYGESGQDTNAKLF
jgi:hypothetical protein